MPSKLLTSGAAGGSLPGLRSGQRWLLRLSFPLAAGLLAIFVARPAQAVPSFAEQTGQPCASCHVGGFGPQLTPFGREFKLNGYTMRAKPFNVPLAVMGIGSFNHTKADLTSPPDHTDPNDNFTFDQGSVFLAGGIGHHFGGFAQITYDGIGRQWSWDNVDLRAVTTGKLFGQDAVFGLTLNNSPTTQDVWNTTPAWGFPYTDSAFSPGAGSTPLIDGALAQNSLGLSAYAWIGQKLYLEAGAYTSPRAGTLSWLGVDPIDPGDIHGLAPYGRIAYQSQLGGGTLEVGAFALKAALNPGRDRSSGFTDHYSDVGLDTSWQKSFASGNTVAAQLRYVHESNNLAATCVLNEETPDCARTKLSEVRGDISYSRHGKLGATLGGFATSGTDNAFLYGGKPDSNGAMLQLDYTPWGSGNSPFGPRFNARVGAQYTAYGKFAGTTAGASDNNTLRIFTWVAF